VTLHRRRKRKLSEADRRAITRGEIERHAIYARAADTEDFHRWIVAWIWHQNPRVGDPVWAVVEAARRMGRERLTDQQAADFLFEAEKTPPRWRADALALWLGVKYAVRQRLKLTRIGSVDVGPKARKDLRRHRNRLAKEQKRRALGARPRGEYEAAARLKAEQWKSLGISRRTWERRQKKARVASVGTALLLNAVDRLATRPGGAWQEAGHLCLRRDLLKLSSLRKATLSSAVPTFAATVEISVSDEDWRPETDVLPTFCVEARVAARLLAVAGRFPDRPFRRPQPIRQDRPDSDDVVAWAPPHLDEVFVGGSADVTIREVA
jgi:hypothetical protein